MLDVPNFCSSAADFISAAFKPLNHSVESFEPAQRDRLAALVEWPGAVFDVQAVVSLRMLGVFGVMTLPSGEPVRMIAEKTAALTESMDGVTRAIWAGKGPYDQAEAFTAPLTRTVRENRARLHREMLT